MTKRTAAASPRSQRKRAGWGLCEPQRKIGLQRIEITLDRDTIVVTENGNTILEADDLRLGSDKAYLYLQRSSHSNYRMREVFFDDVRVRVLGG